MRIIKLKPRDCEHCPCSWENRSFEGDADCGCLIYDELSGNKPKCYLPRFILSGIAKKLKSAIESDIAAGAAEMAEWHDISERKDRLFHQALHERMFVDSKGRPAQPLYKGHTGEYYPYTPSDKWAKARMDYEENLRHGLPRQKAFKKAIAEYLTPELYYETETNRYEPFRIFTNSIGAMERYHELLMENKIDTEDAT